MGILSAFPGKSKPKLQSKTVTPTTSSQSVTADSDYDGLEKVTVNAVKLQSKTATPTTSAQTIRPDSSYIGLSQVTINAMSGVAQATPSISVSSDGLITASATQSAGYVGAGTKSSTKQLTTQAAKTWTPGTANQNIPSGTYLTGNQTIQGDSNLVAGNIKKDVSIFGVTGSYVGGKIGNAVIGTGSGTNGATFSVDTTNLIGFYILSPIANPSDHSFNSYPADVIVSGFYQNGTFTAVCVAVLSNGEIADTVFLQTIDCSIVTNQITITGDIVPASAKLYPIYQS